MFCSTWTGADKRIVDERYRDTPIAELARMLSVPRTPGAIRQMAHKLSVKHEQRVPLRRARIVEDLRRRGILEPAPTASPFGWLLQQPQKRNISAPAGDSN